MAGRLEGKRAIVTGAASGIGRASAELFAREGASLVIADWAEEGLEQTLQTIRGAGGKVTSMRIDAGREDDVRALVETAVRELGGLDVFFANAGISGPRTSVRELEVQDFQEMLRVNLIGPFLAIKHGAAEMAKQGKGSIVCTASVAGLGANAGPVAYSASKAGVIGLVRASSHDLRGTGVRVNAICPGLIETNMTQGMFNYARERGTTHKLGQFTPLERAGQPVEIAQAALFLASDDSSYVHGQALPVDGGLTASVPYQPPRK